MTRFSFCLKAKEKYPGGGAMRLRPRPQTRPKYHMTGKNQTNDTNEHLEQTSARWELAKNDRKHLIVINFEFLVWLIC